jgi:anti-sigma-K factor RskA
MANGEHIIDLIPAYALDCLDEEDFLQATEHLAHCETCREELRVYQELADQLPLALVQETPPLHLKQTLMDQVRQKDNQVAPKGMADDRPSWWSRLTNLLQHNAPVWGLAGLAVIIILVFSNILLWQQFNRINSSPLPVIALTGTDFAPQAAGTIVVSRDGIHGALVVDGLKPLDEHLQYQLWLIRDGARSNGGVFSVDTDGYASLYIDSSSPLESFDSFGITIEPTGGSPAPTGEKVLGSNL